jgi:Arc/MetJ-type ribon-helix-helix transcriptional regulator
MTRTRLSATIESRLMAAARHAVAEGRAESVSGWVNDALRRQADNDRRMKALDEAIRAYEAEFGKITEEEIREATRSSRARAIRVKPRTATQRSTPQRPRRRARGVA